MGTLKRRLETLERRYLIGPRDPCPEHLPSLTPAQGDVGSALQAALRAFSPDPAERAEYLAEQAASATAPPCPRCGWQPFVVVVQAAEKLGTTG